MRYAISLSPTVVGTDPEAIADHARHAEECGFEAVGDGWFPGGLLPPDERRRRWEVVRSTAAEAGREVREHTRWGSIDLTPERAEALAGEGVTRLVVSPASPDPAARRDEMAAFADRFGLAGE